MKYFSLALLFTVIFFNSCSVVHSEVSTAGNTFVMAPLSERDGSSFEKGIPLSQTNRKDAIAAEQIWLNSKFPGHKVHNRIIIYRDKHPFERVTIKTAEGKQAIAYFDASTFMSPNFLEKTLLI